MASLWAGNLLDKVGTALKLPEMGWSETIAGGVPTATTGYTPQSQQAGMLDWRNQMYPGSSGAVTNAYKVPMGGGQVLGTTSGGGGGAPVQQIQQQQQPQQQAPNTGNDWGSIYNAYYGGWGQTEAQNDFYRGYGGDVGALALARGYGSAGQSQEELAQRQYQMRNQELNTQYDRLMEQLSQNKAELESSYTRGKGDVEAAQAEGEAQVETSKKNVGTYADTSLSDALRTYQDTRRQNRMMARSMGILPSSAYMDIQSRTTEGYGDVRADILADQTMKLQSLDTELVNLKKNGARQIQSMAEDYNNLIARIQSDERFTERERNDALEAALVERDTRINEIREKVLNFETEIKTYKMQVADAMKSAQSTATPTQYDMGDIVAQAQKLANGTQQPQQTDYGFIYPSGWDQDMINEWQQMAGLQGQTQDEGWLKKALRGLGSLSSSTGLYNTRVYG